MNNLPSLDLTFAPEGEPQFLREGVFSDGLGNRKSLNIAELLKAQTTLRAKCILLLLVKYGCGEPVKGEDTRLFRGEWGERSWVDSLGEFFQGGRDNEFFKLHFAGRAFINGERSSGGKGAYVTYNPQKLPIDRLRLWKWNAKLNKAQPIEGEELASFAKALEKISMRGNSKPWQFTVDRFVQAVKVQREARLQRPNANAGDKPEFAGDAISITAAWKDYFAFHGPEGEQIRERLKSPGIGDTWYIVSIAPQGLVAWKNELNEAVENKNVTVKWVYHAPDVVRRNEALQAQWQMLHSYAGDDKQVLNHGLDLLNDQRKDLARFTDYARAAAKRKGCEVGRYEFYESSIVHFYMAFMSVPAGEHSEHSPAPEGTFCLVQPYLMFPADYDARCGIYLRTASPVLDLYYRSIRTFFLKGQRLGYLKRVSLRGQNSK